MSIEEEKAIGIRFDDILIHHPRENENSGMIFIKSSAFFEAITRNHITIMGMDIATMVALRCEYMKQGGTMPMTPQSVKAAFTR